jgi:hypothetical protein
MAGRMATARRRQAAVSVGLANSGRRVIGRMFRGRIHRLLCNAGAQLAHTAKSFVIAGLSGAAERQRTQGASVKPAQIAGVPERCLRQTLLFLMICNPGGPGRQMPSSRIGIIGVILALSTVGVSAQAQYPNKQIIVIVPFAAGGPTDVVARLVADHMSRTLGQQLVIENVGGGGGTIGMTRAAQAEPDGYTIAVGNMGTQSAAPALYPNLRYDPAKSFAQVGVVNFTPQAIVSKKDLPAKDLKEFRHRTPLRGHAARHHAALRRDQRQDRRGDLSSDWQAGYPAASAAL